MLNFPCLHNAELSDNIKKLYLCKERESPGDIWVRDVPAGINLCTSGLKKEATLNSFAGELTARSQKFWWIIEMLTNVLQKKLKPP